MRINSELWVKAYVRRCFSGGAFAVVMRHGDDRAGAIFVKINLLDGRARLFGPAPAGLSGSEDERRFVVHAEATAEADVETLIRRQIEFDSDVWVIEIEDRNGRSFLDD